MSYGLYHPSFNPTGAMKAADDKFWYDTTETFNTKADCFNPSKLLAGSGTIASGKSGRPDGRYTDAIYADGYFGVDDHRLSAWGKTVDDILGEADADFKNGTERGLQKLVWTEIEPITADTVNVVTVNRTRLLETGGSWKDGDLGSIGSQDTVAHVVGLSGAVYKCTYLWNSGGNKYLYLAEEHGDVTADFPSGTYNTVLFRETNLPVSGEFTQTDVIGDPANILVTPDLTNGWLGNWIPVIPDGVVNWSNLPYTRKNLSTTTNRYLTNNNGSVWSTASHNVDSVGNAPDSIATPPVGRIEVWNYTAHAYITEAADNAVVYQGTEGVGGKVFEAGSSEVSEGNIFAESILQKAITSKVSGTKRYGFVQLNDIAFSLANSKLITSANWDTNHDPINLTAPDNNSPAVKALTYVSVENGQIRPYYAYKEMVWDTTLDSGSEFIDRSGTASETYVIGNWYHVNGGRFSGYWLCEEGVAVNLDTINYFQGTDGNLYNENGDLRFTAWDGNGWGDDNLIDIANGRNTKTDLNGNTVVYGTARAAKPKGWIKNNV